MNPGNMSAGRPLKECPNPSWLSFLYCLLPLEPDWLSPMQNKACTCQQNGHTLKASQGRGNVFLPEVLTRVLSLLFPGHFFFFFFLLCALSVVLLAMPILDFFLYSSYLTLVCLCVCVQSCLTLQPQELYPTRLLSPWNFPSKNTGVDCHF